MSQRAPGSSGRGKPRWSVVIPDAPSAWHEALGMALSSGLPSWGRRVKVGPPLLASGPSFGSPPFWVSPVPVNPQELSSEKLNPFEVVDVPVQLTPPPSGDASTD